MLLDLRDIEFLFQITVKVQKHLLLFSDLILSWTGDSCQLLLVSRPHSEDHCPGVKKDLMKVTFHLIVSIEVIM